MRAIRKASKYKSNVDHFQALNWSFNCLVFCVHNHVCNLLHTRNICSFPFNIKLSRLLVLPLLMRSSATKLTSYHFDSITKNIFANMLKFFVSLLHHVCDFCFILVRFVPPWYLFFVSTCILHTFIRSSVRCFVRRLVVIYAIFLVFIPVAYALWSLSPITATFASFRLS